MSLVKILGREYRITGVDDPDHLEEVAGCVDGLLQDILKAAPESQERDATMLAALNLASEVIVLRRLIDDQAACNQGREDVESRVQAMIDLIDSV